MIFLLKKIKNRIVNIRYILRDFFLVRLTKENNFFLKRMFFLFSLLILQKNEVYVGSLWVKPSITSWFLASLGLYYNINSLGNSFSKKNSKYDFIHKLEEEIIRWNKNILKCSDEDTEGYVTSGGTESNLFLMWSGREYLLKKSNVKPVLIISDFTHYSIKKSARILSIDIHIIGVNKTSWSIDGESLQNKIIGLVSEGYTSIMIPITIGYSSTGMSDPLNKINSVLEELQLKYPQVNFYVWVDAAAQGLVKSFLNDNFKPFNYPLVQGYVIDFHKLGQVPLPAGLVLYRKDIRGLIESKIDYLSEFDGTVSGSRPGFSILSIWGNIISKKENDWKKHFLKLENKKKIFIKRLKIIYPNINLIYEENSLTIAIIINDNFSKLSKKIEGKFGLVECNVSGIRHYKIHILR